MYPQPSTRLVIISTDGDMEDLSPQSSSSTVWVNGKFNQRTDVLLPLTGSGLVLGETDLVQCEVRLPGTEYREILYRKLVTTQPHSTSTRLMEDCVLLISVLTLHLLPYTTLVYPLFA